MLAIHFLWEDVMMMRRSLSAVAVAGVAAYCGPVSSSGFALVEQNASGLGNAYAGQAAAAEDASTIFFNPAGMTRIPGKSLVAAGHLIKPSAQFNNSASSAALFAPAAPPPGPFRMNGAGGDAGDLAVVPNAYFSWQVSPRLFLGVGLGAPFGLKTEYESDWLGRFHAIKSDLKTINVNPSIAFKVNDSVSVGFGLNWQRVEAELTKAVNYSFVGAASGSAPLAAASSGIEGANKIEGDDDSWGFNLGVMLQLSAATTVGISYRSAIGHTLSGAVSYSGRPAALTAATALSAALANQVGDSAVTADLRVPALFSIAVKQKLNSAWEMLVDASWTQWSSLKSLNIIRSSGIAAGNSLEDTPFNWRDTWRVGLGFNYRMSDAWTWRVGVAYDQSPASDTYRTPRVPDQDRTWLAVGGQYRLSKAGAIDFGYAHLFIKDASITMNGPPTITAAQALGRGNLIGRSENKVDILSIQYRHSF